MHSKRMLLVLAPLLSLFAFSAEAGAAYPPTHSVGAYSGKAADFNFAYWAETWGGIKCNAASYCGGEAWEIPLQVDSSDTYWPKIWYANWNYDYFDIGCAVDAIYDDGAAYAESGEVYSTQNGPGATAYIEPLGNPPGGGYYVASGTDYMFAVCWMPYAGDRIYSVAW
jgi:hypothetical protein